MTKMIATFGAATMMMIGAAHAADVKMMMEGYAACNSGYAACLQGANYSLAQTPSAGADQIRSNVGVAASCNEQLRACYASNR